MARKPNKTGPKNKDLPIWLRLGLIVFGLGGAIVLIVYSFRWEDLPFQITLASHDITPWAVAGYLVLMALVFNTALKSGLLGKWRLD